jgi:uncharacterized caspase-like protein
MDKWAILVGVKQYPQGNSLSYSTDDISEVGRTFCDSLGFAKENITMITDDTARKPIRSEIFQELAGITNKNLKADDLLVFYFSGHGMRGSDNQDYLLPCDATQETLLDNGIPVERVINRLTATGCKNIVMFLDACRVSGGGAKGPEGNSIGDNSIKLLNEREGIITFFSCSPRESSYEIDDLKHGSFTFSLLEAFKNPNCVTVADIDRYLRENVPTINQQHHKPPQIPYTVVKPNEKNFRIYFATSIQMAAMKKKTDELNCKLGDCLIKNRLSEELANRASAIISDAECGFRDELHQRTFELIERFCDGKLIAKMLKGVLDANERSAAPTSEMR